VNLTVEEIEAQIRAMTPEAKARLKQTVKPQLRKMWLPQGGKQSMAFYSEADELLYGGAAGGGKTDLLIGLATTAHERSVLFRRQSNDLDGLWDRLAEVTTGQREKNNSVKKHMVLLDGRSIDGAHLEAPGSEKSHQGRARDFMGFDEGAQLDEQKVEFVTRWLRSTTPGQRVRMVIATNPPVPEIRNGVLVDTGSGEWLKRWFAPWLDPAFTNAAEEGELRWCYMVAEGDRLTSMWVAGPGVYDPKTGEKVAEAGDALDDPNWVVAKSRTFIRSLVDDNVFLKDSGYKQRLSATPEPLRSMLMFGDFTVKPEDSPMQVIPTAWVLQAQERWRDFAKEGKRLPMLVLSGDIAQGGIDTTVLAPLRAQNFFDELVTRPGSATPTGKEVTTLVLQVRQNNALIVLDGGGSWGGSTRDLLDTHHGIQVVMFQPSGSDGEWTDDMLYKYGNNRAMIWWQFRQALDPKSGEDIMLPPSPRLLAQLTAPNWYPRGKLLMIESKDELRVRIGSSTDEADAVLQAWRYRTEATLAHLNDGSRGEIARIVWGDDGEPQPVRGESFDFDDPLKGW
jgi:hypothetical protein